MSLNMAPFDRPYATFYWSAIVNIALSCTIFQFLTLNNIVTLKSGLEVTQGHWNWCHSKAWVRFPKMFDAGKTKTRIIRLPYGEKKLWRYVKPFSSDTGTLRTDGQTDRWTDRFAISISRVSMLTRDKNGKVRRAGKSIIQMLLR